MSQAPLAAPDSPAPPVDDRSAPAPASPFDCGRWVVLLPAILLATHLARSAIVAGTRRFNVDEFEHVHAAWYVLQGDVPYRDFFEHHHPLLWYLLAPLVALTEPSFDVLFVARGFMWLCFVGCSGLLFLIGRRLHSATAGFWAAVLWTSFEPVLSSGYEVRPDTPMTLCLLGACLLLLRRTPSSDVGGGALAGLALLFLQKAVLFAPALAILLFVGPPAPPREHAARAGRASLGFLLTVGMGALALWVQGGLAAWWEWAVVFNQTAPPVPGQWYEIGFRLLRRAAVQTNTLATLAIVAGGVWLMTRERGRAASALVLASLVLIASLALTRRPYSQYLLPALTLPCILGGVAVSVGLSRLAGDRTRLVCVALIAFAISFQNRPVIRGLERTLYREQQIQRERFEYAMANSSPRDVVFQGYPSFNLYRRDATFFWFLPFDLPVRAQRLGLHPGWSFRETILSSRPAIVTIGTARTYPSEDTYTLHHRWLIEEAGYRWIDSLLMFARVPR